MVAMLVAMLVRASTGLVAGTAGAGTASALEERERGKEPDRRPKRELLWLRRSLSALRESATRGVEALTFEMSVAGLVWTIRPGR